MERIPLSLDEEIDARFVRRGRSECWMWEGDMHSGSTPRIRHKNVLRRLYERERGPIPRGWSLWRTDHSEFCEYGKCRHRECVNPWHVEAIDRAGGTQLTLSKQEEL
jgi:hypothetical protein